VAYLGICHGEGSGSRSFSEHRAVGAYKSM